MENKAQKENGYTPIANEIIEKLCITKLTNESRRVLDCIFRKTYGYHKKEDWISLTQFECMTRIKKPHINRAIKHLMARKIINRIVASSGNDFKLSYCINTKLYEWCPLPNEAIVASSGNHRCLTRQSSLPNEATTKDNITKDNITKDKPYSPFFEKVFDHWNSKNIIKHVCPVPKMLKCLDNRLKTYDLDQIMQAIDNYAQILRSDSFFKYKWTLTEFLQREGALKFYPGLFCVDNFLKNDSLQDDTIHDRLKQLKEKLQSENRL